MIRYISEFRGCQEKYVRKRMDDGSTSGRQRLWAMWGTGIREQMGEGKRKTEGEGGLVLDEPRPSRWD